MSRSTYTRLGDHIARDRAGEIRRRAAENPDDKQAQAELAELNAAASPDGLRKRVAEIVRNQLQDADGILGQAFPNGHNMTVSQYGDALYDWYVSNRRQYEFDSPEGRTTEIIRICAMILQGTGIGDLADDFNLGVVLGYGLAAKNHLLVREFADGPALARERDLERARAKGGETRADAAKPLHDKVVAEFMAARRANPRISAKGWATKNAKRFNLAPETVRKILGAALQAAKNRPSTE